MRRFIIIWVTFYVSPVVMAVPNILTQEVKQLVTSVDMREFQGISGQIRYAQMYFNGEVERSYENVSTVLSEDKFKSLGWSDLIKGTAQEVSLVRGKLIISDGKLVSEYLGQAGYSLLAKEWSHLSMDQIYERVQHSLSAFEMNELGWSGPSVYSVDQFDSERSHLIDEKGMILEQFKGQDGQARYASLYHGGEMFLAHKMALTLLSPSEFDDLEWSKKAYFGKVRTFSAERSQFIDAHGKVKSGIKGREGYINFVQMNSTHSANESMVFVYKEAQKLLSESELKDLDWKLPFEGKVSELIEMRQSILNREGNIDLDSWFGRKNMYEFVKKIIGNQEFNNYKSTQIKVLNNLKVAFSEKELSLLGWDEKSTETSFFERMEDKFIEEQIERNIKELKETKVIDAKHSIERGLKK